MSARTLVYHESAVAAVLAATPIHCKDHTRPSIELRRLVEIITSEIKNDLFVKIVTQLNHITNLYINIFMIIIIKTESLYDD